MGRARSDLSGGRRDATAWAGSCGSVSSSVGANPKRRLADAVETDGRMNAACFPTPKVYGDRMLHEDQERSSAISVSTATIAFSNSEIRRIMFSGGN